MKVITWGSGGTYATLGAAYSAAVWDDDITFQQSGTSTEATTPVTNVNQNGYTCIIKGDGTTVTLTGTSDFYYMTGAVSTGDMIIRELIVSGLKNFIQLTSLTGTPAYKLQVFLCKFTGSSGEAVFSFSDYGYNTVDVFACDLSAQGYILRLSGISTGNMNIYFEDVTSSNTSSTDAYYAVATGDATKVTFKRVYHRAATANAVIYPNMSGASGVSTEIFSDNTDPYLPAQHQSIPFTTVNFESIGTEDELYGVPKATSILYTAPSQTSNIADNIVGLNGETVDHRAAGAYTPPVIVLPPTGVSYTLTDAGVKITWTNTVQAGYTNTDVYWETTSVLSSFVTPKAQVGNAVTEYTIPYAQLATSPIWYVRLTHRD